MARILVTGSRDWTDEDAVSNALWVAHQLIGAPPLAETTLVHGAARGADLMADAVARRIGMQVEAHPVSSAEWAASKGAGHARNARMVAAGADICVAFIKNQSRGATGCAAMADQADILVAYCREEG